MLAVLGFLGLAMSSFVMLGRDDTDTDDVLPGPEPDTAPGADDGHDSLAILSETEGDAGAGGVLADDAAQPDAGVTAEAAAPVDGTAVTPGTGSFPDEDDHFDDLLPDVAPRVSHAGTDDGDTLAGGTGADDMFGGAGNDEITGNLGDDLLVGADGDDTLTGGDGADTLYGGAGDDTLAGGWGDDVLVGDDGADLLMGGRGNDTLDGRDADDGFDYLNGGAGDDVLLAGRGDHLNGGDGADTFAVRADGDNTIDDFDPTQDVLEITYAGDTPPVLSTVAADDGLTLMADDAIVAHLSGITELDLSTVVLVAA